MSTALVFQINLDFVLPVRLAKLQLNLQLRLCILPSERSSTITTIRYCVYRHVYGSQQISSVALCSEHVPPQL